MKKISEMSREELIEEVLNNQKEGLAYLADDDLKSMLIDFRTSAYKRDLVVDVTGQEIKPHIHYHDRSVGSDSSDHRGHGHGFL